MRLPLLALFFASFPALAADPNPLPSNLPPPGVPLGLALAQCGNEYLPTIVDSSGDEFTIVAARGKSAANPTCANLKVVRWEVSAAGKVMFEDATKSRLVSAKVDGGTLKLVLPVQNVDLRPVLADAKGGALPGATLVLMGKSFAQQQESAPEPPQPIRKK